MSLKTETKLRLTQLIVLELLEKLELTELSSTIKKTALQSSSVEPNFIERTQTTGGILQVGAGIRHKTQPGAVGRRNNLLIC